MAILDSYIALTIEQVAFFHVAFPEMGIARNHFGHTVGIIQPTTRYMDVSEICGILES